jgi:hypothetical protein
LILFNALAPQRYCNNCLVALFARQSVSKLLMSELLELPGPRKEKLQPAEHASLVRITYRQLIMRLPAGGSIMKYDTKTDLTTLLTAHEANSAVGGAFDVILGLSAFNGPVASFQGNVASAALAIATVANPANLAADIANNGASIKPLDSVWGTGFQAQIGSLTVTGASTIFGPGLQISGK